MQRAFDLDIPETLAEVVSRRRTALLVYDMQAGIIPQMPPDQNIVSCVADVLSAARAARIRVFYTRHMSLPNEVSGVVQLRTAMAWQRVNDVSKVKPAFPRDSPQFQIVPELAPTSSEAVFDKLAMSAFVGTPLDMALRDCDINSLVIVGVALEVGIEPTVRHAMDLGYIPILVTDACGWHDGPAAERAKAQLEFFGGSILTNRAPVIDLFRRIAETS
jgi:nicotinamidase-related amidase